MKKVKYYTEVENEAFKGNIRLDFLESEIDFMSNLFNKLFLIRGLFNTQIVKVRNKDHIYSFVVHINGDDYIKGKIKTFLTTKMGIEFIGWKTYYKNLIS